FRNFGSMRALFSKVSRNLSILRSTAIGFPFVFRHPFSLVGGWQTEPANKRAARGDELCAHLNFSPADSTSGPEIFHSISTDFCEAIRFRPEPDLRGGKPNGHVQLLIRRRMAGIYVPFPGRGLWVGKPGGTGCALGHFGRSSNDRSFLSIVKFRC